MDRRIGIGYDIHRLTAGRKLILGGVEIPFASGLLGHSDSDALCHAITDALLGAACLGDIGSHFPDSDPAYQGISSLEFLIRTREMLRAKGLAVINVDSIVIAEQPKLNPHIPEMRRNLASVLEIDIERVNVKAKTAEGLGPVGEGKAIAAQAVVLIGPAR